MIKAVSQIHGGNGLFNKQQWVNLRAIYKFSKSENDINPDSISLINPNKNKCTHTHTHTPQTTPRYQSSENQEKLENLKYRQKKGYSTYRDGLPRWFSGKKSSCQCRRHGFDPCVGNFPWRKEWQPTLVFLPGKSHGQRNLSWT